MNITLLKALVGLVPVCLLLWGAAVLWSRRRTLSACLQMLGAACFAIVLLTHVAESLAVFPEMGWGQPQSVGHYLNLVNAILGLTIFPIGYFLHALKSEHH
jgi:Ca2+/Na+ antiporter